jgi:hypothetical protein
VSDDDPGSAQFSIFEDSKQSHSRAGRVHAVDVWRRVGGVVATGFLPYEKQSMLERIELMQPL